MTMQAQQFFIVIIIIIDIIFILFRFFFVSGQNSTLDAVTVLSRETQLRDWWE